MYDFGYILRGAEGIESEPAAAGVHLAPDPGAGTEGCVALPGARRLYMGVGLWVENTLGLCEEWQSTTNYSLCFDKITVASVLAMARVKRRMLSVSCTGQQLKGFWDRRVKARCREARAQEALSEKMTFSRTRCVEMPRRQSLK